MSILKVDKDGPGDLFTFTSGDRVAFLTRDTTYYQTVLGDTAFYNNSVADIRLTIAGEVVSEGSGLISHGLGSNTITVASTGFLYAYQYAIFVDSSLYLDNAGEISGVVNVDAASSYASVVTNSGRMTGNIGLGGGVDHVSNYGLIIGDIVTNGGDDTVDTHLGTLQGALYGGAGNDTYVIAGTEAISESQNAGHDQVISYGDYHLPLFNVEDLTLMGAARNGYGNNADNSITGNDNGNTLMGLGGNDLINGGLGADNLKGGDGDDQLFTGDAGADTLSGGNGDDFLLLTSDSAIAAGGAGNDTLVVNGEGAYQLNGGAGNDLAVFGANNTAIVVNLATQTIAGGNAGDDKLFSIEGIGGTDFSDTLTGSAGDNVLYGFGGNDSLVGGAGNDRLEGGAGIDRIDGGDGIDTAEYGFATAAVSANLTSGKGFTGDALGDVLIGIENLTGGGGADTLIGSDGANVLSGGEGNDSLNASAGNDTLIGGAGNDVLIGGTGADVFAFADVVSGTPGGFGTDTITAFTNGEDKISFVGSDIDAIGDLTITQSGTYTLISDGHGDLIRLQNFDKTLIDPTDFIFG